MAMPKKWGKPARYWPTRLLRFKEFVYVKPLMAGDAEMQNQESQTDTDRQEDPVPAQRATPAETDLEHRLASAEARLAETYDAFMRAKADGENIRRWAQEDVVNAHKFAVESFSE